MRAFLRRMLIPAIFAFIFIVVPVVVIGYATLDGPEIIGESNR